MSFKTIIRSIITLILSICFIAAIILAINGIRGEGITFTSLSASLESKRVFYYLKNEEYEKAAKNIGFWTYSEINEKTHTKDVEEEKLRFSNDLQDFFSDKSRELVKLSNVDFKTNDGLTTGTIDVELREGSEIYIFTLILSKENGKFYLMSIREIDSELGNSKRADELILELNKLLRTHNPD